MRRGVCPRYVSNLLPSHLSILLTRKTYGFGRRVLALVIDALGVPFSVVRTIVIIVNNKHCVFNIVASHAVQVVSMLRIE